MRDTERGSIKSGKKKIKIISRHSSGKRPGARKISNQDVKSQLDNSIKLVAIPGASINQSKKDGSMAGDIQDLDLAENIINLS